MQFFTLINVYNCKINYEKLKHDDWFIPWGLGRKTWKAPRYRKNICLSADITKSERQSRNRL